MKGLNVFLWVVIGLSICCNKNDNPMTTNINSTGQTIMSLKIGNKWLGTFALYDSTGRKVSSNDTLLVSLFEIVSDTMIQGEQWYITTGASLPPNCFDSQMLLIIRNDGLWGRSRNSTRTSVPYLVAKFPGSLNDSYLTGKDTSYRATLISTNRLITVPRGTYSCYQYESVDKKISNDLKTTFSMFPDSGFISVEQYSKTSAGQYYMNARWSLKTLILT